MAVRRPYNPTLTLNSRSQLAPFSVVACRRCQESVHPSNNWFPDACIDSSFTAVGCVSRIPISIPGRVVSPLARMLVGRAAAANLLFFAHPVRPFTMPYTPTLPGTLDE